MFRAVSLSFDPEKLLTGAAGLLVASLIFGICDWLGLKTGERSAHLAFTVLGAILATCIWILFAGIVAKMSLTQLIEGRKAGAAEIRRFLAERWATLLGTPVAFVALALLFLGLMVVVELVGAVPGVGPIVFGASFLLAFILAFMGALTVLVHLLGAFLYPSVIALRGAGAGAVLLEMFGLVRRKGFWLIVYEMVVGAVGALMTGVIGTVVWASVRLVHESAQVVMKEKFEYSMDAIPEFFRLYLRLFERWLPYVPAEMDVKWHYDLSGLLLGLSHLCIVVLTAVYPFVFFNTAGSITYLILRGGHGDAPPGD